MHPPKGIRRAIRNEIVRQGLGASAKQVVAALANYGVRVDEDAVQRVRIELLQDRSGIRQTIVVRRKSKRRPQKIPAKRPWRRDGEV